jgi:hypothetical protein
MTEYFEAPTEIKTNLPSVFLAGGIGNCPDWQAEAVELFADREVALFNPRRVNFPEWNREQSEIQIRWEFDAIAEADVTMFWFPAGPSMQPIALFELGGRLWSGAPMVVGRDPEYLRADDIDIQVELVSPGRPVYRSLAATVAATCRMLEVTR